MYLHKTVGKEYGYEENKKAWKRHRGEMLKVDKLSKLTVKTK